MSTDQARDARTHSLGEMPEVDPLAALRGAAELVALLQWWQWETVYAARRAGASWAEIASVTGVDVEQARHAYTSAIERQEQYGISDTSAYREVL